MRGGRYNLLQSSYKGIQGRHSRSRKHISWLRNLRADSILLSPIFFKTVVSKVRIAMTIANLFIGDST